jgi:hypothetical protein
MTEGVAGRQGTLHQYRRNLMLAFNDETTNGTRRHHARRLASPEQRRQRDSEPVHGRDRPATSGRDPHGFGKAGHLSSSRSRHAARFASKCASFLAVSRVLCLGVALARQYEAQKAATARPATAPTPKQHQEKLSELDQVKFSLGKTITSLEQDLSGKEGVLAQAKEDAGRVEHLDEVEAFGQDTEVYVFPEALFLTLICCQVTAKGLPRSWFPTYSGRPRSILQVTRQ